MEQGRRRNGNQTQIPAPRGDGLLQRRLPRKKDEDGALLCAYGCIACGLCVNACRFDAIHLNEFGCAEVDDEKCIGCGACARKCPRHVIKDRFGVLTPVH